MNKKGMEERLYFWIFYFIILIIIMLGLFNYINGLTSKSSFNQNYLARNIALVLNTIYASPGDIEVMYSISKKDNFIFIIGEGIVTVRMVGDILNEESYYYQEDKFVEDNFGNGLELKYPSAIFFSKRGDVLEVKGVFSS